MDCSQPGFSVTGISQQEYWSGLPFPSPGTLPHTGIKSASPVSPELTGIFFLPLCHQGSPSLITKDMQIKTTISSACTKMMGIDKKGYRKAVTLIHCWWKCEMVLPLWKTRLPSKLNMQLPYNPEILLLDTYLGEIKTCTQKDLHIKVHKELFTIAPN